MATLTINIPDAVAPRVVNAFAARFGYDSEVDGTKAQFLKKQVVLWMKEQVRDHEANTAAAATANTAATSAESDITLT